ncbi:DUF3160 domain-containing protein [Deinococcus aquaedulcis]|uniref:DUF3160 domain-containing protein n=1 Tax=Deinococcus aquaedulcis TaxID=2840455 RepID=UPI001C832CE4|nr:DUF3160 domain-containing protein [Deinococcus aquaedulcis]
MRRLTLTLLLALPGAALLPAALAAPSSYTLPVNLSAIKNQELLRSDPEVGTSGLSPAQRAALSKNGFVIAPATWAHFDGVYEATRYLNQPVFVTTDSMLHAYHLVFSKLLRDLEREALSPALRRMTALLVADARRQHAALKGTALEGDARRALAYLAVAQELIDPATTPPAEVAALVAQEVRLIDAHQGQATSPIFAATELEEDYSQYVPRGHYTRSDALKRYFRTMMWLGRLNLRVKSPGETRVAALLTNLISGNPEAQKLWARIYDPTALLIGRSDDLDYRQYAAALRAATGGQVRRLANPAVLSTFQAALAKLPLPQVNSLFVEARPGEGREVRERETLGFRMMGQRFTLDGAAFQRLVYREVGKQGQERWLPRGLDLLAALGSDAALNELRRSGEDRYANYLPQMAKVRASFAALKEADWTANVYSGWLYALQPLAKPAARDARYPAFMRTAAWTRKEMLTALGSWTELRHDTILYAKQTMAEMGGIEEPQPARGYVEPNAAVWTRLLTLEALTRRVLAGQGVLSARTKQNLDELRAMLTFLNAATARQLAGQALSAEDYERLHLYGGWLEQMKLASADPQDGENASQFDENDMAAVVADVATGNGRALEQATGYIHELYAVVPDGRGGLQVARGGVYSQYEFTVPAGSRLTNEAWRAQLRSGKVPPLHPWLSGIVVK